MTTTTVKTEVSVYKESVLKEMLEFTKGKRNSYDRHLQEAAYWTSNDCIALVKGATTRQAITLAKSIFDRYKWYL